MESRLGRAILVYRLYHLSRLEQLADGWWQFVAQEAEVGLPGEADWAEPPTTLEDCIEMIESIVADASAVDDSVAAVEAAAVEAAVVETAAV